MNAVINVVSATNPTGSAFISPFTVSNFDLVTASVTSLGGFLTFQVPARTIT